MKSSKPELSLVVAKPPQTSPERPRRSLAQRVANIIALALVAGLILSPYLSPPCGQPEGMSPMRCHWTFQVDWLLSVAVLLVSGALWFLRGVEARRTVGAILALFGALVVAVSQPWVIGLCKHPEMACHSTAHWLWLWSAGLAGVGGYLALAARLQARVAAAAPDPWESTEQKPLGAA
jgi:hypothetical protein